MEFIPFFVVSHIDILGMARSLLTTDDLVDVADFEYESKDVRKNDPLVHLDPSEIAQIKFMNGSFNRDVAFDMDDDILILPNFINRKKNQLVVISTQKMIQICLETEKPYVPRQNTFKPHLDSCSFIVEDSCI